MKLTEEEVEIITGITQLFAAGLPEHKSSLHLTHNDHKSNYQTVEEYARDGCGSEDWLDGELAKAIEANEVWCLQWYPQTPVGFCKIHAASLHAIILYLADLGVVQREEAMN